MRRKCTFLSYLDTLVQFYRCRLLILKDCCSYLAEPFRSMCFGSDPNPFGSMCFGRIRIRLDPCILVGTESVRILAFCRIWIRLDSCVLVKSEIRLDPCALVWCECVWIHVLWSNPYPVSEKKTTWSGSIKPGFETLLSQESQYW